MLYDGSVIAKETNVISIADSKETLMLEEESRSKMLLKQSDPMVLEKKVNIKLINYAKSNRLFEDFGKRFVLQKNCLMNKLFGYKLHTLILTNLLHPLSKWRLLGIFLRLIDNFKPSHVRAKEHIDSLVNQLNQKSVKVTDLNAQLQEKVFVITTLKNDTRNLKGKEIVDNVVQVSNATTIAPGMYKLDPIILAHKVKNNREAHEYYLKNTIEQAAILREVVKQAKLRNPLDSASYSACMYVKLIQELLGYVRDTCLDIHKPSEKLVTVTPINKTKTVRLLTLSYHQATFPNASGSKPPGNTKKDRIQQTQSRAKKNKLEAYPRNVRISLHNKKSVVNIKYIASV
nr:hypothetical protein [Tanacetum cinerariifolium]